MGNELAELLQKKITRQMPRDELQKYIVEFLESHNMCVLATAKDNIARATPIEYCSNGTILYMATSRGTKLDNIRANPWVSIGIHAPLTGWLSLKGIQITGKATLITTDNPEWDEAVSFNKRDELLKEIGLDKPPRTGLIIKVESKKIELVETALRKRDYASHQVWEASES